MSNNDASDAPVIEEAITAPGLGVQLNPYFDSIPRYLDQIAPLLDEASGATSAANVKLSADLETELFAGSDAWRRSGAANALARRLSAAGPGGWTRVMREALDGPDFARIRKAIDDHNAAALVEVDLSPVNSYTITYGLDIEAGLSFGVGIAFTMDAKAWTYMTVSLVGQGGGGAEIGAAVSQTWGVGGGTPDDAGGLGVGLSGQFVAVTGGIGSISVNITLKAAPPYFDAEPEQWSVAGGVAVGGMIGGGLFGSAAFIFDTEDFPNCTQPDADNVVRVYIIRCDNTEDNVGKDEVYFEFIPDTTTDVYRYPLWSNASVPGDVKNSSGAYINDRNWVFGRTVKFNTSFTLKLHQGSHLLKTWTVELPLDGYITETTSSGKSFKFNYYYNGTTEGINDIAYKIRIDQL